MIFASAWLITVFLYALHLSLLLLYPASLVIGIAGWIIIPFVLAVFLYQVWRSLAPPRPQLPLKMSESWFERRLKIAFLVWASLTVFEIWYSGGVPILWLIQGTGQTYYDFGIHSLHGMLNSLLLTIGLSGFALFAFTGTRRHLWMPAFVIVWSIVVITRNTLVIVLLEWALVWAMIRGIPWKNVTKVVVVVLALVLVFGYMGDIRTGADTFRQLAAPGPHYPDWLPSGVLWMYIYTTTPLNNLVNTTQSLTPQNNPIFPNTISQLVPSTWRDIIFNPATGNDSQGADLVENAFNVSTAYLGPFMDFGRFGIACLSIVMGLVSAHFWQDRSLRGSLMYAVLGQCLVISVFFNHLFYLPVIMQIVWLYVFLPKSHAAPQVPTLP